MRAICLLVVFLLILLVVLPLLTGRKAAGTLGQKMSERVRIPAEYMLPGDRKPTPVTVPVRGE